MTMYASESLAEKGPFGTESTLLCPITISRRFLKGQMVTMLSLLRV